MGTAAEMAYIAKCKCGCGSITFATIDLPAWAKETAKSIAKMIRDGYAVERVPLGSFRMTTCKRQADLLKASSV